MVERSLYLETGGIGHFGRKTVCRISHEGDWMWAISGDEYEIRVSHQKAYHIEKAFQNGRLTIYNGKLEMNDDQRNATDRLRRSH